MYYITALSLLTMPPKISQTQAHLTDEERRAVKELGKVPPEETPEQKSRRLEAIMVYLRRIPAPNESHEAMVDRKKKDESTLSYYKRKGTDDYGKSQRDSSKVNNSLLMCVWCV